ncbi:hypothetical protein BJV78DRAFT_417870 [Lactifluus subvellereus]|nr:hypothetical protein BJV78DRAFT_417870 [Lactifluus subvellereus]
MRRPIYSVLFDLGLNSHPRLLFCSALSNLMPPSLAVGSLGKPSRFDRLGFVKYMKNIGRVYRKQAMELVSICRLFVQAEKQTFDSDMKLREALEAVDEALKRAAEAKKKTSEEADVKFEEAVRLLSDYEKNYHFRPEATNVAKRVGEAKLKDTSSSTIISKLFHAKPTEDGYSEPTTVVEFLLHKSLPDSSPTIVTQMLSKRSNLQEIFWNFSRMKDEKKRLTLKQNPHFYEDLPASQEAYGHQFQTNPMKDFVQAPKIYVLTDKPGRVYLETEQNTRAFGNFWVPNGAIIFKDVCGKLEGESIVGASIEGTPNIWYREEPPPSPTSPSGVRAATVPSPPSIITASPINSSAGDWRELVRRTVDCEHFNIRISTKAAELPEGWTLHSPINSGPNSPSPSQPFLKIQISSPSFSGPLTGSSYKTALQSPTLSTPPSQRPPMGLASSSTPPSAPLSQEPRTQASPQPAPSRALPTPPTPYTVPPKLESQPGAFVEEVSILSQTPTAGNSSSSLSEPVASPPEVSNFPGPLVGGSEAESGVNPPRHADAPSPEQLRATSLAPDSGATPPSKLVSPPQGAQKRNWFQKYFWDYVKGK